MVRNVRSGKSSNIQADRIFGIIRAMENTEKKIGFFSRICMGLSHPVTTFIFGVVLPAASVTVEMSTGICSEAFGGDLTSNVFQCAAMCAVPVLNFIVWLCCLKGWGVGSKFLRAMCGFSFGIAVVYAFAFLPLSAIGAIFFCLAWRSGTLAWVLSGFCRRGRCLQRLRHWASGEVSTGSPGWMEARR